MSLDFLVKDLVKLAFVPPNINVVSTNRRWNMLSTSKSLNLTEKREIRPP
jgi:hypothetical protein